MEMSIALDADRCRGDKTVIHVVETAEWVYLPFAVMGELRVRVAVGKRGAENERTLRKFLAKEGVEVLYADDGTTALRGLVPPAQATGDANSHERSLDRGSRVAA